MIKKTSHFIFSLTKRLLDLTFPPVCEACGRLLVEGEHIICTHCFVNLQRSDNQQGNSLEQKLRGRAPIERAVSISPFMKGSIIQILIHSLKYKNRKEIGFYLGRILSEILIQEHIDQDIDIIIPIPLHWRRKKKRGYNQSELIAIGIAEGLNRHRQNREPVTIETKCAQRMVNTETQTIKNGEERWKNVQGAFQIKNTEKLLGKKILFVDDVVTTGSTLISLLDSLRQLQGICLYVASATYVPPSSPIVPNTSR